MDLKGYYRRVRETEATLPEGDVVVVSLATPDGGKEGVLSEVSRNTAARLTVDGKVRITTPEEAEQWKQKRREALQAWEEANLRQRVQIRVISDEDLRALRGAAGTTREGNKGET